MATFHDRTTAPKFQGRLLRGGGTVPCRVLTTEEVVAEVELAGACCGDTPMDTGSADCCSMPTVCATVAQSLDGASALNLRRQLEEAAEHGVALLAALGLPRLVEPGFDRHDILALGDALDLTLAALDALDGDPDLEDGDDAEHDTADSELSCGWTAKVDQLHLGHAQDEHEATALERHGKGFVRSGPDDAEDDDGREHSDNGVADEDGLAEQFAGWNRCLVLPHSVGGHVA